MRVRTSTYDDIENSYAPLRTELLPSTEMPDDDPLRQNYQKIVARIDNPPLHPGLRWWTLQLLVRLVHPKPI